ncbi:MULTISPECIES: hypothetical protein [Lactobacillaceae]|uniref:hypothetical protein n=1 Tax=Lactobacillaceae TaxID=33958 RepID=UPI001456BE0C|nr:hypothetical protein [Lactobacillus sp. HBUAS51381]NLR10127.1 hypothetical protein [Lactobacillus sp. HBUAS51381]
MNVKAIIDSLIFIVIIGLLVFLIINFITDFRTTLLVVFALLAAAYVKHHFFKRHADR